MNIRNSGTLMFNDIRSCIFNYDKVRVFFINILVSLGLKSDFKVKYFKFPENVKQNNKKENQNTMKIELRENYVDSNNSYFPPIFILMILVAQVTSFVIYGFQLIHENDPKNMLSWITGIPKKSPLIFDFQKRYEVWRFFSYMLIHQGYAHIAFNCLLQLLLGIPLELEHKFWKVCLIFINGVLGGSLASSIIDDKNQLVGSSGGSYGLIGAHVAIFIINWDELKKHQLSLGTSLRSLITSGFLRLIFLVTFLLVDLLIVFYRKYGLHFVEQTSYASHIGGFVMGLLIGISCLRSTEKKMWKIQLIWLSLIMYTIILGFAILWNIFYPFKRIII